MKEEAVLRKIIGAVREKYPRAWIRKLSDKFTRGLPDLLILFPRCHRTVSKVCIIDQIGVLFVETKRTDGGKTSKLQEVSVDELRRLVGLHGGCYAIVATTVDEVLKKLHEMGAE